MTPFRPWSALFLATAALVVLAPISTDRPQAQTTLGFYTLTDLGTLGGGSTQAYDLNDSGQVVGYSVTAASQTRAFLWADGTMTNLGTLTGSASYAHGVNGLGHVVGFSAQAGGAYRATLWRDGGVIDLTPDIPVDQSSSAAAINDTGQIAGTLSGGAFLLENGSRVPLGDLGGGSSSPAAINAAGQIAGTSYTTLVNALGPIAHAFLWQNGVMTDLGVLSGDEDSSAGGINDLGVVVGSSGRTDPDTYETAYRPFIYANGMMTPVPVPSWDSYGSDINDAGVAVGTMKAGGGFSKYHAWVYADGVVTNLNSLIPAGTGLHLAFAYAVNNDGQIAGVAVDAQARYHGFLLTPGGSGEPIPTTITIDDVTKSEGNGGTTTFAFAVRLSAPTTVTVRVNFATADGSAAAGQDYTAASGELVFNAGETSKMVFVAVKADRKREADETFTVNLSGAGGGTIADAQGSGVIRDDDR